MQEISPHCGHKDLGSHYVRLFVCSCFPANTDIIGVETAGPMKEYHHQSGWSLAHGVLVMGDNAKSSHHRAVSLITPWRPKTKGWPLTYSGLSGGRRLDRAEPVHEVGCSQWDMGKMEIT